MAKLTSIGRTELKLLGQKIVDALAQVGEEYGVKIRYNGGQFGGVEATLRLQIDIADPAIQQAAAKRDWDLSCFRIGLEPQDFGATFISAGLAFTIVGIQPGKKNPIMARQERNQKIYVFPASCAPQIVAARRVAK